MLAGPWAPHPLALRVAHRLGRLTPTPGILELAARAVTVFPAPPSKAALLVLVREYGVIDAAGTVVPPYHWRPAPPAAIHRPVAALHGHEALAGLLWLHPGELAWFADRQRRNARAPREQLRHYRYRMVPARSGPRLLEIPKVRLREVQRRVLESLLTAFPRHPASHGGVPGRSVLTAVTPHAGKPVLIRCDLASFFTSVTAARVLGIVAQMGLDAEVTALLTGLCTTETPAATRQQFARLHRDPGVGWTRARLLATPHLPQGAPTSPALADAACFGLDQRLAALARSLGGDYTRYVDDLLISGPQRMPVAVVLAAIEQIVNEESFRLARTKTSIARAGHRQQALGVVINARPGVARAERDRLRAVLHQCRTQGVTAQLDGEDLTRFRARLEGRIAWVASVNPEQGARLRASLGEIDWQS